MNENQDDEELIKQDLTKSQKKKWKISLTPINVIIYVALIGLIGNAIAKYFDLQLEKNKFEVEKKLEQQKFQSSLVLKALDAGDTINVSKMLLFLINTKLLEDEDSSIRKAANNPSKLPLLYGLNVGPSDLATVLVANATTNPCDEGPVDGCWKPFIEANPGDIVSVQIYFHLTEMSTLTNVAIGLKPKYSAESNLHTFTGVIASGDNILTRGSATISLTKSGTLSFIPGSIRFSPNQLSKGHIISGEEYLFSGYGLNIDKIEPGWTGQGTLVVDFKVSK